MEQVTELQSEACGDFDVFADLAEMLKLGGKAVYTEGKDEVAWLKQLYDVAQKAAHTQRVVVPQFSAFRQRNELIEIRESEENNKYVRYADFCSGPVMNTLGTPSGKIKTCSKTAEGYQYKDRPPHIFWIEPGEWKGTADKDQLQLLTAHPAYRPHSQLNYASLRKKHAIVNRELMTIHPDDAKARGVTEGDLIRVWNAHGQVLVGAYVSDGIKPDIIYIHEGAWPGIKNGTCRNDGANVLTADIPTSRLANGCAGNISPVHAGEYTGEAPKLTVSDEPTIVTIQR